MNDTPNLALPYILAAQAQKHVTHNEAIRALDCLVQLSVESRTLTAPPAEPANGARYVVAASPTGAWSGQADKIAAFQDGAWMFYAPKEGWAAWVAAESALIVYAAGSWSLFAGSGGGLDGGGGLSAPVANSSLANMANGTLKGRASSGSGAPEDLTGTQATALLDTFTGSGASHKKGLVPTPGATAGTARYLREDGVWSDLSNVPLAGVNTTADATNKFAVKSQASLFDNAGSGHQQKINKAAAGNTASQLYQTNYSGRAELGLTGDDDFHFKVSADGTAWREAIKIDRNTGKVTFPQNGGAREVLTASRTYYVRTDGSNSNDGLSNTAGGAFLTIQKAIDVIIGTLDFGGFSVTIQVADGSYTSGGSLIAPWTGGGSLEIRGNTLAKANVSISVATGAVFSIAATLPGQLNIRGFKLKTGSSSPLVNLTGRGTVQCDNIEANGNASGGFAGFFQADGAGAKIIMGGDHAITGGGCCYVMANNGGQIQFYSQTITITGTLAFSWAFVQCLNPGSTVSVSSTQIVWGGTGTVTGQRYGVTQGAVLNTNGGGASYLPGSTGGMGSNFAASPWGLYV